MIKGIGASPGIAIGKVFVLKEESNIIDKGNNINIQEELNRFSDAIEKADTQILSMKDKVLSELGDEKWEIFEAHRMMLRDPDLVSGVQGKIENEVVSAEYSVSETVEYFRNIFLSMDNDYMKERAADIHDVGKRLIRILSGKSGFSVEDIDESCIIASYDLTPSETAQMNKELVQGFITDIGGRTSHSAIMARSLELPAVVGLKDITVKVQCGDTVIVDGNEGMVIINPDESLIEEYRRRKTNFEEERKQLDSFINVKGKTTDGRVVEVVSNIGNELDAEKAEEKGADGVGLFRTEFLYMDRDKLPTEEEQFNVYKKTLENMNGKEVIIRTLDIGGDKKVDYLKIENEMNPFLGYRAIRLCLKEKEIFKTQLRAILRASVYGYAKIMFPMISSLEELMEAKAVLNEVKEELSIDRIEYNKAIEIGIMIEIPSAAVISDILAKEIDFFSIGTNDLIQYTTAVDRMNERIAHLYNPFNPGVLRLIKMVIDNAHRSGKKVGMCGETAGDKRLIPIYLGFGLDEFSMSTSSVLAAKKQICGLNFKECEEKALKVLEMGTAKEIMEYVEGEYI